MVSAVLDAGPCDVGLESTIVGIEDAGSKLRLLRPGGLAREDIEQHLGAALETHQTPELISAPGQLASHYAPKARLRLNATDWTFDEKRLGFGDVDCDLNLSTGGNLTEAACNLFHCLHLLDAGPATTIAVSPIPNIGLGQAINDRLQRAAAPR
jgi:L-threonylcarbamoyladenylate synthase